MKALFFLFAAFLLTSCGKFSDGSSVWQDWVWTIPVTLFLASGYSFFRAGKAYRSGGSWSWGLNAAGVRAKVYSDKPARLTTIGAFWFGVVFLGVGIAVVLIQNSEK